MTASDFHRYNFAEVWRCSPEEANRRVFAFYASKHFQADGGLKPVPGARDALLRLRDAGCELHVVTSRQKAIRDTTLEWLSLHYKDIFTSVQFGNHFVAGSPAIPKSALCKQVGATLLVDDNNDYAMECAAADISVLHFNLEGKYAWGQGVASSPNIIPVTNWSAVEEQLTKRLIALRQPALIL